MTGRALRDSVQIATKFTDMEKTYLSLNSLRLLPTHPLSYLLLASSYLRQLLREVKCAALAFAYIFCVFCLNERILYMKLDSMCILKLQLYDLCSLSWLVVQI